MQSQPEHATAPTTKISTKLLWLLASSVLLLLSTGATPIPLAAWLVGVFALRFGRSMHPLWGYLALALASMPVIAWSWSLFPFGGPIGLAILAIFAGLISALPVLFDRLVSTRLHGLVRTLPFPVAATAVDFLLGSSPDFGSWGATGYSQIDSLAAMQVVSVTGLLGLTFMTAWFASAVNAIWEARGDLREGWLPALPAFVAVVLMFTWGQARIAFAEPADDQIQVTAIGGPRVQMFPNAEISERWKHGDPLEPADISAMREHGAAATEQMLAATERAAASGSKLIAWGEGGVVVVDQDVDGLSQRLQDIARRHATTLVAAIVVLPTGTERQWDNKVLFVSPDSGIEWQYQKAIPTPGSERAHSQRGDGVLQVGELGETNVSAMICYDLDFPDLVAQAQERDVDILVAPAGDWPEVAFIHAKMARSRAIEQGLVLVRPTTGGVSVIYDGLGRVLAQTHTIDDHVRSITAWVPARRHSSLHASFSGPLGWSSVLVLLVLIGLRIARRKAPEWFAKHLDD